MARSSATTVQGFLDELPPERREVISKVREVILKNLPKGYEEALNWGGLCYEIPLERYPNTYNKQPLAYIALAPQKNYYALYLMGTYIGANPEEKLRAEFEKKGRKLDMGKSCVRFRKLDDLPLDVIGKAVASTPPEKYIEHYEQSRRK